MKWYKINAYNIIYIIFYDYYIYHSVLSSIPIVIYIFEYIITYGIIIYKYKN